MTKNRRWLFLLLAAGLISLGAGGGTFATFNAETTNPGNSFATGSLELRDSVSSTACFSWSGTNNQNTAGTGCSAVINIGNQAPTTSTGAQTGVVNLTNVGSLAGTLTASASACTDSDVSVSQTVSSLAATTTTITVGSTTGIAGGMQVTDTAGDVPAGTYVDNISGTTITLSAATTNAATVSNDKFTFTSTTSTTGNPLCSALDVYMSDGSGCLVGACPTGGGTAVTLASLSSSTIFTSPPTLTAEGGTDAVTVGIYLPSSGTGGADNSLMGLSSSFGLTFTLTQS